MSNLEMKVDALMRLVSSDDGPSYDEAKAEVLRLMNASNSSPVSSHGDLVYEIEDTLSNLGMSCHIRGFGYCVEAIRLAVEDERILEEMTKQLYPRVAKKFDVTPSKAERAIRHGIEMCWNRGDLETLTAYFGYSVNPNKGKTTNSEFISRVASVIRRKVNGAA